MIVKFEKQLQAAHRLEHRDAAQGHDDHQSQEAAAGRDCRPGEHQEPGEEQGEDAEDECSQPRQGPGLDHPEHQEDGEADDDEPPRRPREPREERQADARKGAHLAGGSRAGRLSWLWAAGAAYAWVLVFHHASDTDSVGHTGRAYGGSMVPADTREPTPGFVTALRFAAGSTPSMVTSLRDAVALLATFDGFVDGRIARAIDDSGIVSLTLGWTTVGAYRRALSSFDVKMMVVPLLAQAIDEPSAFEVLQVTDDRGTATSPGALAADARTVSLGHAAAAHVEPEPS